MIVSKIVDVVWNAKTKRHYTDLGYSFTKMGDTEKGIILINNYLHLFNQTKRYAELTGMRTVRTVR